MGRPRVVPSLKEVDEILTVFRKHRCRNFTYKGITAELDLHTDPTAPPPDMAALEKQQALERFKQAAEDDTDLLNWSV